jgi:hypothetical protein
MSKISYNAVHTGHIEEQPTPWYSVFLRKFIVTQLAKKSFAFQEPKGSLFHYYAHKSLLLGPIMSQLIPVHTLVPYFCTTCFNIFSNLYLWYNVCQVVSSFEVVWPKFCITLISHLPHVTDITFYYVKFKLWVWMNVCMYVCSLIPQKWI